MTSPAVSVPPDATLDEAYQTLVGFHVSAVAVVESGALVGVLSRTDLLRVGRRQSGSATHAAVLTFPQKLVRDVMTSTPQTVAPEDSVAVAARIMAEERLHRVFVSEGGNLRGVFSTHDAMKVVQAKRLRTPISDAMSSPVFSVRADEPVSLAVERLEKARVSGLVVVDENWPVGIFAQTEALLAASSQRTEPVENLMSSALICLEASTPLHRAAAHGVATNARRILAMQGGAVAGIVTGLDFARIVAG